MKRPTDTIAAFDLGSTRLVSLIGGGGKTTPIAAMTRDLVGLGRRVVVTTTTRIRHPRQGIIIIEPELDRLVQLLVGQPQVTVAKGYLDEGKLEGFSGDEVERLANVGMADVVLVEADGAAGRPLKAHGDFEPVIPSTTDLVVAVIGIDCIGEPLSATTVHRAERFADLLGLAPGHVVAPETVAAIVLHPQGYLRQVAASTRVAVMLNKVDDERADASALACAEALRRADHSRRIERIVIGTLKGPTTLLRVV